MNTRIISLENWDRFQHYKDRDPPWVKLYRDLLTSESWVLGTDVSRLVQVASTLLAARYGNFIPYDFRLIRKVASLDCTEAEFDQAISHLASHKFLSVKEKQAQEDARQQSASTSLATCTSEAEKRQSREESEQSQNAREAEVHRGTSGAGIPVQPLRGTSRSLPKPSQDETGELLRGLPPSLHGGDSAKALAIAGTCEAPNEHPGLQPRLGSAEGTGPGAMQSLRQSGGADSPSGLRESADGRVGMPAMPPRASRRGTGDLISAIRDAYPPGLYRLADWLLAERAIRQRVDEGTPIAELMAAATAYAEQQVALEKAGTQYVLKPSRFFGSDDWRGPFPLPAKPENAYDRIMRLNGGAPDNSTVIEHEPDIPGPSRLRLA